MLKVNVGAAIPGAQQGILGGFIVKKLQEYVEPTRAGTPKGQPVGLSRKKFHAAILCLTNVDLRKQAQIIRVSYGVLRKWRSEDALYDVVFQLEKEFIEGPFLEAAELSMDMLLSPDRVDVKGRRGINVDPFMDKRRLIGFEDAALYSLGLVMEIFQRFSVEALEAIKTGKMAIRCLAYARPLGRLYREAEVIGDVERMRRLYARYLAGYQSKILSSSLEDEQYRLAVASIIADLIRDALAD
jgi:hypothetical protein